MAVSISGSGTMTGLVPGGLPDGCVTTQDFASSVFASRDDINGIHTTGSTTSGTGLLTVASVVGIEDGMVVVGQGIPPGTTVSYISGTTVALSVSGGVTFSSKPVAFYRNSKAVSPGSVGGQLCRAWVNFDGTGTVAIRASFNVSSITDNGVGNYTVNFTTAMPDGNYSICGTTDYEGVTVNQGLSVRNNNNGGTTSSQVLLTAYDGTLIDNAGVHVAIFR